MGAIEFADRLMEKVRSSASRATVAPVRSQMIGRAATADRAVADLAPVGRSSPIKDPSLFAEVGRVAPDYRVETGLIDVSAHHAELIMKRVADRRRHRGAALTKICE